MELLLKREKKLRNVVVAAGFSCQELVFVSLLTTHGWSWGNLCFTHCVKWQMAFEIKRR